MLRTIHKREDLFQIEIQFQGNATSGGKHATKMMRLVARINVAVNSGFHMLKLSNAGLAGFDIRFIAFFVCRDCRYFTFSGQLIC